jgi:hypothetical protein
MNFVDVAQILSAFFTAAAAVAAFLAVRDARTASRGQTLVSLLDDYSSTEMGTALRDLAEFARQHEHEHDTRSAVAEIAAGHRLGMTPRESTTLAGASIGS